MTFVWLTRYVDSRRWSEAGLQLYPRSVLDTLLWKVRLEWDQRIFVKLHLCFMTSNCQSSL